MQILLFSLKCKYEKPHENNDNNTYTSLKITRLIRNAFLGLIKSDFLFFKAQITFRLFARYVNQQPALYFRTCSYH